MKRLMLVLAVLLVAALSFSAAGAQDGATTIEKAFSADAASLGDRVTVTLTANVSEIQGNATLLDSLPPELTLLDDSISISGGEYELLPAKRGILCYLAEPAVYTIQFDVVVTTTEGANVTATNCAFIYDYFGVELDSACAEITIEPYAGFFKEIRAAWIPDVGPLANVTEVPVGADVHWEVVIGVSNIPGDSIGNMTGIEVRDRFGGDLELDAWSTGNGTVETNTTGRTNKVHLTWTGIAALEDDDAAALELEISTDVNPGTGNGKKPGHQEYTEAGEHELNSGAVLKFIDPTTGLKLSAHTAPLVVTAVEAVE